MENPAMFNDIKIEPPEELLANDFNLPQVEPVDLSFHKPKTPLQPASMLQAPICPLKAQSAPQTLVVSTSTSDTSTSANIPTVLTPGSILASSQGTGGQQILHVIHTIPSISLQNKMGGLKTIPVVVQSLPMMYTTLPEDGGPAAITVPLIGGDGKNAGSVKVDPTSMSPLEIPSDSEESAIESGSSTLQSLQGLQQEPVAFACFPAVAPHLPTGIHADAQETAPPSTPTLPLPHLFRPPVPLPWPAAASPDEMMAVANFGKIQIRIYVEIKCSDG
ncbi:Krueppel-like factor 8 [Tupaia chinensis]|uniref:Krueppel-like factor 8 n=1 Tax=Tupaia chinensis TaxID=246437 RepID=L8YAT9_TUPCH|nr:Krueppel-like factor 8 [Tupaia chinensis]